MDLILSYLSPRDLAFVSATNNALRQRALSEHFWHGFVQQHVPGLSLRITSPCATYRQVYVAFEHQWFLTRHKLWFCDHDLTGRLIIARFDPRRACIEGYQLLAVNKSTTNELWTEMTGVAVNGFEPELKLHLDKPALKLHMGDSPWNRNFSKQPTPNRYAEETPMLLDDHRGTVFSSFMLAKPLDAGTIERKFAMGYPYDYLWPPPAVPAEQRVSGYQRHDVRDLAPDQRPHARLEVSHQTFRIRQWMEIGRRPGVTFVRSPSEDFHGIASGVGRAEDGAFRGARVGEEIITYSTLDPSLYTPSKYKPWRGIWVGDYNGHGCEFLLIHQPDDPPVTDAELGLIRRESETSEQWEQRKAQGRINRGRLEGIKLTGDPNVPRGERIFYAEDIGPDGCIGLAKEPPFMGTRMVRSKGHVASPGFRFGRQSISRYEWEREDANATKDRYIDSRLLLISHDLLAQYWTDLMLVSFYRRVDVDSFLTP